MHPINSAILIALVSSLSGCAHSPPTVWANHVEAWKNVPVEALDNHSFFMSLPMVKTFTDSGDEFRDYVNKADIFKCMQNTGSRSSNAKDANLNKKVMSYADFEIFRDCSSKIVGCDNVFLIRGSKVIAYWPMGSCFTNDKFMPEKNTQHIE